MWCKILSTTVKENIKENIKDLKLWRLDTAAGFFVLMHQYIYKPSYSPLTYARDADTR